MEPLPAKPCHVGLHFVHRPRLYIVLWLRREIECEFSITSTYEKVTLGWAGLLGLRPTGGFAPVEKKLLLVCCGRVPQEACP